MAMCNRSNLNFNEPSLKIVSLYIADAYQEIIFRIYQKMFSPL